MTAGPWRQLRLLSMTSLGALGLLLAGCGSDDAGGTLQAAGPTITPASITPTPSTVPSSTVTSALSLPTPGDSGSTTSPSSDTSSTASAGTASTQPMAPGAVPNCLELCNIVLEGDSLTKGLTDWVCLQVKTGACINSGISGNRVDQMIDTAPGDVDIHLGSGGNDVLVLWGGTNDMWQQHHAPDPTANAEAIYGFIADYIAQRRASGWDYIFVVTNPPANPSIIKGSDHLNQLIRANTAGADAVIDIASESRLADPFDTYLRADDGVHYKDPGREIVVYDHIVPAIRSLNGG